MIGHDRVRAERQLLPPPGVLAVGGRVDDHFLDAGTGRVGVAVDQPDDVRPVARHFAADHEPDGLARLHAQAVGVADDAPLDEVLGHLLADAHVRPLDRRRRWRPGPAAPALVASAPTRQRPAPRRRRRPLPLPRRRRRRPSAGTRAGSPRRLAGVRQSGPGPRRDRRCREEPWQFSCAADYSRSRDRIGAKILADRSFLERYPPNASIPVRLIMASALTRGAGHITNCRLERSPNGKALSHQRRQPVVDDDPRRRTTSSTAPDPISSARCPSGRIGADDDAAARSTRRW